MTLKTIVSILIGLQVALLPNLAQAQSSDFDQAFAKRGAEARLSFTIPLGKSSQTSKTAPRLEFGIRNYSQPSKGWLLSAQPEYQETRLGFTLGETPQLMLNDQILILSDDEQANIGTAGKIGLGIAAVALVSVAVVAVLIVDCDNRDCFDEE